MQNWSTLRRMEPRQERLIHEFYRTRAWCRDSTISDNSIESFARSCFNYALDTKQDLWFATKDTISKKYDHTFQGYFPGDF